MICKILLAKKNRFMGFEPVTLSFAIKDLTFIDQPCTIDCGECITLFKHYMMCWHSFNFTDFGMQIG